MPARLIHPPCFRRMQLGSLLYSVPLLLHALLCAATWKIAMETNPDLRFVEVYWGQVIVNLYLSVMSFRKKTTPMPFCFALGL